MDDNGMETPLGRDSENVPWILICKSWKEARHIGSHVKVLEFVLSTTRNHWNIYILSYAIIFVF